MNTLQHALISYFNALFGIAPATPEQQERDRLVAAGWEHWRLKFVLRHLEKSLRHFDESLANIEAKANRARQQGRQDKVSWLAAERARLETLRVATETERGQVSRKMEAICDWIRYTLRRPW